MRLGCLVLAAGACWSAAGHAQTAPALKFNGDFRVRYEHTSAGNGTPSLGREVVRFRLGATYAVQPDIVVQARMATGDPDDPNSTDVSVGKFANDLLFSLDLASVEVTRPKWYAVAGKFRHPFLTTELVWDGDVNPEGAGARVTFGKAGGVTATLSGMYFVVDLQPGDSGSDMRGGQFAVNAAPSSTWRLSAAAAYYDYQLGTLVNTSSSGDIRGNRLAPGGTRYLSDFDLIDALVTLDYTGFGKRFPVRLVGEYVHNSGADDLNAGFGADVYVGGTARPGDFRARYGYAQVETDAVLAAFAHDNTTLGTNSETHTLAVDVVPRANTLLTGTLYIYAPHQPAGVFQTRLRVNAMVTF